jgi:uncharacterized LabA/DUF88 family protein
VERVIVSIDGPNFFQRCRENLGRTDVNLGAFASYLVGPARSLVRTYFYTSPLPSDADPVAIQSQQRFFGALHRIPYVEVRLGRMVQRETKCQACGNVMSRYQEKGLDMRIGIDLLVGASRDLYDTAILVSGDGDLSEAVRAVKELGKHVELAALPIGRSYELVQVSDVIKELTLADMTPLFLKP